ncbi:agmatinase, partial [Nonlabens mediterrranea]|nr:agmatinase [Nonlabens mediterrranea]
FAEKNVVGFDIVELCPNPSEKSSDFLAAKLYYKMLSYKFKDIALEGEDGYEANNAFTKSGLKKMKNIED